jgi:hypothetical protein
MLPGFRAVIAGIFVTVVLPLVAFGIAGNFRSAHGTSLSPMTSPGSGTALIEYYWSQFYAPATQHPGDAASTEVQPGAKTARLAPQVSLIPETFGVFDTPPIVETTVESSTSGEAGKHEAVKSEPEKPQVPKPEIAATVEQKPVEIPKAEVTIVPEVPKTPERIARLPDAIAELRPVPVAPPVALPEPPMQAPVAKPAESENAAPEAATPSIVAAAPIESPETAIPAIGSRGLTGSIPLPPKRPAPAIKRPARASSAVHRNRPRSDPTYEQPFIPLKNSLFESLFGGMGKT